MHCSPPPPRLCKHISMTCPRSSSCLRSNKTGGRQKLGAADIAERTKPQDEDPYQPAACAEDDLLRLKGKKKNHAKLINPLLNQTRSRGKDCLSDFVAKLNAAKSQQQRLYSDIITYIVEVDAYFFSICSGRINTTPAVAIQPDR